MCCTLLTFQYLFVVLGKDLGRTYCRNNRRLASFKFRYLRINKRYVYNYNQIEFFWPRCIRLLLLNNDNKCIIYRGYYNTFCFSKTIANPQKKKLSQKKLAPSCQYFYKNVTFYVLEFFVKEKLWGFLISWSWKKTR